ncbi:hypothetical protein ABK040_014931 [Willaertia magna]
MSQNLIFSVWGVSEELLKAGHLLDAIHCLDSLLKRVGFDREPLLEVETRLRLSQILSKYTRNFHTCQEHLTKGNAMLQEIINQSEMTSSLYNIFFEKQPHLAILQIQFFKQLGSIYSQMNDYNNAVTIYYKAIDFIQTLIDLSIKNNFSQNNNDILLINLKLKDLYYWRNHFRIFLIHNLEAENYSKDRNEEMENQLLIGENEERNLKNKNNVIAYYLIRIHQLLKKDLYILKTEKIFINLEKYFDLLVKEFGFVIGEENHSLKEDPNLCILYLNYLLLFASFRLQYGNLDHFKSIIKSIQETVQTYSIHTKQRSEEITFEFLDIHPLTQMAWLIGSLYYRSIGFLKKSDSYNMKGISNCDRYLKEFNGLGFQLDKKRNDNVLFSVFIKINLLFDVVIMDLSKLDFVLAVKHMKHCIDTLSGFHDLFIIYRFNIHFMLGILFCLMEKNDIAVKHFEVVIKSANSKSLICWSHFFLIISKWNTLQSKDVFNLLDKLNQIIKSYDLENNKYFQMISLFIRGILCFKNEAFNESKQHFNNTMDIIDKYTLEKCIYRQCVLMLNDMYYRSNESSLNEVIGNVSDVLKQSANDSDTVGQMISLQFLLSLNSNQMEDEISLSQSSQSSSTLKSNTSIQQQYKQLENEYNQKISELEGIQHDVTMLERWFAATNENYLNLTRLV